MGEKSLFFGGDVKFLPVGKILLLKCELCHTGRISIAKALWDFALPLEDRLYATFSPASLTNLR